MWWFNSHGGGRWWCEPSDGGGGSEHYIPPGALSPSLCLCYNHCRHNTGQCRQRLFTTTAPPPQRPYHRHYNDAGTTSFLHRCRISRSDLKPTMSPLPFHHHHYDIAAFINFIHWSNIYLPDLRSTPPPPRFLPPLSSASVKYFFFVKSGLDMFTGTLNSTTTILL
ncbi:AT-hook motif nuclear-localized protein [Actinidia chinensis var. chinensis]|uniref:AT-hook motif nuclear-localized protein n=1 Tax=Actinidia chinensis var. chinensis TaxID=1590841 RepID=A0A2R6PWP1_ACTCC|nr:AT-hook motif nuclear-localized protein [Actinidia chinensis var. chinensis]